MFVLIRAVCEPKLRPGREIWDRVLGLEPVDVAVLAGVRFVGTFSLLVGLGGVMGGIFGLGANGEPCRVGDGRSSRGAVGVIRRG